jgi:sacsin
VYEFLDSQSGAILIAEPPPGVRLESLLAQAVSKALRSPVVLPLEPLLSCTEAALPAVQQALLPGAASTLGKPLLYSFSACCLK